MGRAHIYTRELLAEQAPEELDEGDFGLANLTKYMTRYYYLSNFMAD